jgi:hypothetical protein
MKIRQFLEHHGILENPFADEDAQTDLVFKAHCITTTYHPAWDKIYGSPTEPSTAIVFGEKGAGKTALGMQIVRHLAEYNADHPQGRVFVIQYDDFNPFLDRFRDRFSRRRRADRVLGQWKLWDHMDAILGLGVTQLVDRILQADQGSHPAALDAQPLPLNRLDAGQIRDLMLLAACYDQSTAQTIESRWARLRRKLRFSVWRSHGNLALGIVGSLAALGLFVGLGGLDTLRTGWPYALAALSWTPWLWRAAKWWWVSRAVVRQARVLRHSTNRLRRLLMKFPERQIAGQPLPDHPRTDDRYELLGKFQNILRSLGFSGMVVLVDRVDEPYLINGSPERMRMLLWPMLDNKFLKQPGIGLKLLLPAELFPYIDRETPEFHQRARLDKQNLVRSLEWTGQSLYDLANARIAACAADGRKPVLRDLLAPEIDDRRLLDAMRSLRVPRHLFKFLYRLLVTHTNAHTDEEPAWTISIGTFESVLALYQRDQEAFNRGLGAV